MARALVTGRSKTLGVVSFDTTLYGPASTLFGIERAAHEAGYFIIVASLKALNRSSVTDAVERLRRQGVDGILVIAPHSEAGDALLHTHADVPLVAVEAGPEEGVPVVAVDQVAGAVSATAAPARPRARDRVAHHRTAELHRVPASASKAGARRSQKAGAELPEPLVGDWSPRAGYELGRRLSGEPAVTAVFVANDQMALGLLRAMHEAGREVPGELSVVGFDDIPEAAVLPAAADDRPPRLQRDGNAQPPRAAADDRDRGAARRGDAGPAGADRPRQHGRRRRGPIDTRAVVIANMAAASTREEG